MMRKPATHILMALALASAGTVGRGQTVKTENRPTGASPGVALRLSDAQPSLLRTRVVALQRPLSVELRDEPVRQAALTLSQAAGLAIRVAEDVPGDRRLTVVARGVPLATVLDSIARQSGLLIAPYGSGSDVELQPAPGLQGERPGERSPYAPWSKEWGTNPAASPVESQRLPRADATAKPGDAPVRFYRIAPVDQPGNVLSLSVSEGSLTVTRLSGDTFVVAHPAPGGEPALLLTVYRIEGAQLHPIARAVHRLSLPAPRVGESVLVPVPGDSTTPEPNGETTPAPEPTTPAP
jgi:hypothetical protein